MIIWTGYGFLAVIVGIGMPLAFLFVCNGLSIYDGFLLPFGSGLIVAGVFCWSLGRKLHTGELPDSFEANTSLLPAPEKPSEIHTVYFIRIEYWGIVLVVGGLVLLVKLIRDGELQI